MTWVTRCPGRTPSRINEAKEALKKATEGQDLDLIEQKTEGLTKVLYDLTSKVYQQSGSQQQAPGGEPGAPGGESGGAGSQDSGPTVDADYKVVDDEGK